MRVAITGIGGFIGSALARHFRDRGDTVVGLDSSAAAVERARALGLTVSQGDITRLSDVTPVVAGAEVVLHTAAVVGEGGSFALYRHVNVEGSRVVAVAARDAGARRLVHFSSVMVYGFTFPPDITEDGPFRGEGNPYCQTKLESEAAVRSVERPGFSVTVVRPGDVYGAGSVPWVLRPLELMRQGLFVLPSGAGVLNHLYIDTLVEAIGHVVQRDVSGTFNLSDGVATPAGVYFGHLAAMVGKTVRTLPAPVLRPAFAALARGFSLVGKEPPARPEALAFLCRPNRYSIERARRELGFSPTVQLEEGMRRVADELGARARVSKPQG